MKTLLLGLGNPILTDDGVGIKVVQVVEEALPATGRDHITITTAATGGLHLMELMVGYDRAILVDAITTTSGRPGTLYRLGLGDLLAISPIQHTASAHDTSLATALSLGQQMGLPLPQEIVIFAVEAENVIDFSAEMTPAVAAAVPEAARAVMQALNGVTAP